MSIFPADGGLSTVKELRAPAFVGALPDWIVDASDGGTVEALDAGHAGGYWQLSPGGATARVETAFPLDPAAYDVLELETRLRVTDEDTAALVGFENEDESIAYGFRAEDRSIGDRVRVTSGDDAATFDARVIDAEFEHEVVLRWDVTRGDVELVLDGTVAATGDVDNLDGERPVRAFWHADGPTGEFRIHRATVRYRTRHNSV